jgi:hypothetical protein
VFSNITVGLKQMVITLGAHGLRLLCVMVEDPVLNSSLEMTKGEIPCEFTAVNSLLNGSRLPEGLTVIALVGCASR